MQSPAPTYETGIGMAERPPTYSGVTVVEEVGGQHVMRASSAIFSSSMPTREIDQYTVVLRGETFTLYRDQIEFDAPNYFTVLFLGDPREPRTTTVQLSRSPELFRIVVDYMSGYTVLPLAPEMVPSTMTRETALANLLNDAEYYQLDGLVQLIRPAPCPLLAPPETYSFLNLAPRAILKFEDVLSSANLDDVDFDGANGIGSRADGDWKPVLMSMDGVKLIYTESFKPMLTKAHRGKLEWRGLFKRPPWLVRNVFDTYYVKPPYTWHEGTPYLTPRTMFTPQATTRLNGSEIPRDRLFAICEQIARGSKNDGSFDAPVEKDAFETLEAVRKAENEKIILWCRKLIFTISRESADSDSLYFRIVHADCVTRDQISQLAV